MSSVVVKRVSGDVWFSAIKGKNYRSRWNYVQGVYQRESGGWVEQDGTPLHVNLVEIVDNLVLKEEARHQDRLSMESTSSSLAWANEIWVVPQE